MSKKSAERIFLGIHKFRASFSERFLQRQGGAQIVVRNRRREVLGVFVPEDILELLDSQDPLPPEYYAAFCRNPEQTLIVMSILARVSSSIAQQLAQTVVKIDDTERKKKEAAQSAKNPASAPEPKLPGRSKLPSVPLARARAELERHRLEEDAKKGRADIDHLSLAKKTEEK